MPRRPVDAHRDDQRPSNDAAALGPVVDVTAPDGGPVIDVTDPSSTDDTPDDGFVPL